jgi:hypothetical protein
MNCFVVASPPFKTVSSNWCPSRLLNELTSLAIIPEQRAYWTVRITTSEAENPTALQQCSQSKETEQLIHTPPTDRIVKYVRISA